MTVDIQAHYIIVGLGRNKRNVSTLFFLTHRCVPLDFLDAILTQRFF
jgi:hypothetical protein